MQRGSIRQKSGAWHVRYRVTEVGPDGKPQRRMVTKRLAPVNDEYRSARDVWSLADTIVAQETQGGAAEGSLAVSDFVERFFLPFVKTKKKASTLRFYRDTIKRDIAPVIGQLRMRDVQTVHVQRLLDAPDLSHGSLLRIKSACSAVFSHGKRLGFILNNPAQGAQAEGRRSEFEAVAYSLADLEFFLGKLDEPSRTVIAVAAFTGLRLSEIRGLRWEDYDGAELIVRRSVWRTFEGVTKTPESKAAVPVIRPLRKMLDAHKRRNGTDGWIFAGEKKHFALNLDNLARRSIIPKIGDRWHGWQGWRRGLATTLFDLGVDPEVASKILRHADSAVTRRHYIVLESRKQGRVAMRKLESLVAQTWPSKKSKKRKSPRKH
ncbi:MAG TPA: tyrosine-type recombinase/integrase [Terriglobales bacterium]|nr:tyrosine-type recombinase/integrase [Terriglobales bacterium]